MIDFLTGFVIGAVMFGAPTLSLIIVTKGHVRFYDNRTDKVVKNE